MNIYKTKKGRAGRKHQTSAEKAELEKKLQDHRTMQDEKIKPASQGHRSHAWNVHLIDDSVHLRSIKGMGSRCSVKQACVEPAGPQAGVLQGR